MPPALTTDQFNPSSAEDIIVPAAPTAIHLSEPYAIPFKLVVIDVVVTPDHISPSVDL